MEPCYSLIMRKTQNSKSDHKSYLIRILQATVSKCENVTVVMISTAYETTKEMKQQQKEEELSSLKGGNSLSGISQNRL